MRFGFLLVLGLVTIGSTLVVPDAARAQCGGTISMTLTDSGGFMWDITTQGAINNGSIDAYDGGYNLQVGGVYFPASPVVTEMAGRQLVIGPATMSGLSVTRKVYVPTTDAWARIIEFFTNPGATPISVQVRIDTNVGSDGSTVITGSQSGDTTFTTADRWLTTDDSDGTGDPSLNHNFWGAGGSVVPSAVTMTTFSCAGTQGPVVTYDLTVPAGATIAIMTFAGQNSNRAGSMTKAMSLDMLPMAAVAGLTIAEQTQIVNWRSVCDTMDRDMDGASCVAGDCNDGDATIRPGAMERCNGRDDNCAMGIDEGFAIGMACSVGVGFCARTGTNRCDAAGTGVECTATPGLPRMEVCNGIDDDCDGLNDLDEPGLVVPESCNGVDDDCDARIDETWPTVGMPCTVGVGFCAASATERCTPDGTTTECAVMAGMPRTDVCNGIDDDCDGVADSDEVGLCAGMATGPVCLMVTPTSSRCGCVADSDCGAADSGMICDAMSMRCVMGCAVGPGRNGCLPGRFCTTNVEGTTGTCTTTCNFDEQCAATMPDRPQCLRPTGGPGPTNRCVACTDDSGCAAVEGRSICNAGDCVECTATRPEACATSDGGPLCLETGVCGCARDTDCAEGSFCHGTMRRCVTLPDAGPPPVDAGPPGVDAGMDPEDEPARRGGGCGCVVPAGDPREDAGLGGALVAIGIGLLAVVRRRRRR